MKMVMPLRYPDANDEDDDADSDDCEAESINRKRVGNQNEFHVSATTSNKKRSTAQRAKGPKEHMSGTCKGYL